MIYLDYSATTPVNKEVIDSYSKACEKFIGNPNSLHRLGTEAKDVIDASTKQIANILHIKPSEIIYTSGASESNNTAIKGIALKYANRGKHIISTELEHSSIIGPLNYLMTLGYEIDFVSLKDNGEIDLDELDSLIRDDTILVSIASVNSEIGIRQPIEKISEIVRRHPKCFFHSDMTQSVGKEDVDLSLVDLASFSAQKFYGMKGVGILYKRDNLNIEPLIHGGKSTTIYRSGTPALPLIVSISKALRLVYENFNEKYKTVEELNKYLREQMKKVDIYINSPDHAIPHILNFSLKGIKAETMLHALEEDDIFISTQTACSVGDYSRAVYVITNDKDRASSSMRVSLSYLTTKEEIDKFISSLDKHIKELKK
jgi:cysteine desulfurase